MNCLDARTPIRGLYLAGSDVVTLGIVGALVGGLVAAVAATGTLGAARIMTALARGAA
jgi:all-trans-retinol 13,14-reductase